MGSNIAYNYTEQSIVLLRTYLSILEPQCIGEYDIFISPSQDDNECKNREVITVTVDKVSIYV